MKLFAEAWREFLSAYIEGALRESRGNVRAAARRSGLARATFYRYMRMAGIPRRQGPGTRGNDAWRALAH